MNRMRKVLIADDEVKVGQLVKRLIQWDPAGTDLYWTCDRWADSV